MSIKYLFVYFFLFILSTAFSVSNSLGEEKGEIDLVIGAFSIEQNAISFNKYVNESHQMDSKIKYIEEKKIYYVYLPLSESLELAIERVNKMRSETEFNDAWLYFSTTYSTPYPTTNITDTATFTDTIVNDTIDKEKVNENNNNTFINEEVSKEDIIALNEDSLLKVSGNYTLYPIYFNTVSKKKSAEIETNVSIVDIKENTLIAKAESYQLHYLAFEKETSPQLKFICDEFGYRKIEHIINIKNPLNDRITDYISLKGDTIYINFSLERYKKGAIVTMYNVYFYNNAAIMNPHSKYEIDQLLMMLNENKGYKIQIHGHTNGNSKDKIIRIGEGENNYFNMAPTDIIEVGTALTLSLERALTIKKYLVNNGISEERMIVKGWGGKKSIVRSGHPDAKRNVRVEIEILEE